MCVCVWGAVGCIDDEKTRPYAEFVEDYERLLDMQGANGGPDASGDLGGGMAVDMGELVMPDQGEMDQDSFMLDPNNPPECSLQGGPAQTVTFVNGLNNAIDLHWIHFDCFPIKYVTIQPGESYAQSTFVGHVWDYSAPFGTPVNQRVVIFEDTTTVTWMEE